jgi:hypothetical protein
LSEPARAEEVQDEQQTDDADSEGHTKDKDQKDGDQVVGHANRGLRHHDQSGNQACHLNGSIISTVFGLKAKHFAQFLWSCSTSAGQAEFIRELFQGHDIHFELRGPLPHPMATPDNGLHGQRESAYVSGIHKPAE